MDKTLMFDYDFFYSRIAKELPNNCRLCEVGIADGDSVIFLAKELNRLGKEFKLYAVDNFDYGGLFQLKTCYENFIKHGVEKLIEVVPLESLKACSTFNDGFLDFVFIDSSHKYQETKKEVVAWYEKVKDGGILAGHDYYGHKDTVGKAVDELIPKMITRNDIEGREFEPETFLEIHDTYNGFGIWSCKKDFYKKINKQ